MAVDQCRQLLDLAGIRPHGGVDHFREEAEQDLVGAVGEPEAGVAEDPVVFPVLGVVVAVLDDVALGCREPRGAAMATRPILTAPLSLISPSASTQSSWKVVLKL